MDDVPRVLRCQLHRLDKRLAWAVAVIALVGIVARRAYVPVLLVRLIDGGNSIVRSKHCRDRHGIRHVARRATERMEDAIDIDACAKLVGGEVARKREFCRGAFREIRLALVCAGDVKSVRNVIDRQQRSILRFAATDVNRPVYGTVVAVIVFTALRKPRRLPSVRRGFVVRHIARVNHSRPRQRSIRRRIVRRVICCHNSACLVRHAGSRMERRT